MKNSILSEFTESPFVTIFSNMLDDYMSSVANYQFNIAQCLYLNSFIDLYVKNMNRVYSVTYINNILGIFTSNLDILNIPQYQISNNKPLTIRDCKIFLNSSMDFHQMSTIISNTNHNYNNMNINTNQLYFNECNTMCNHYNINYTNCLYFSIGLCVLGATTYFMINNNSL